MISLVAACPFELLGLIFYLLLMSGCANFSVCIVWLVGWGLEEALLLLSQKQGDTIKVPNCIVSSGWYMQLQSSASSD